MPPPQAAGGSGDEDGANEETDRRQRGWNGSPTIGVEDTLKEKKWRLQNKGQYEEWGEFAQVLKGEKEHTLGFEEALVATTCALEVRFHSLRARSLLRSRVHT